jgi:hypothetical protein
MEDLFTAKLECYSINTRSSSTDVERGEVGRTCSRMENYRLQLIRLFPVPNIFSQRYTIRIPQSIIPEIFG